MQLRLYNVVLQLSLLHEFSASFWPTQLKSV